LPAPGGAVTLAPRRVRPPRRQPPLGQQPVLDRRPFWGHATSRQCRSSRPILENKSEAPVTSSRQSAATCLCDAPDRVLLLSARFIGRKRPVFTSILRGRRITALDATRAGPCYA